MTGRHEDVVYHKHRCTYTQTQSSTLTVIHGAQLELSVHPALLCCLLEVFQCQLIVLKTQNTQASNGCSDFSDTLAACCQNENPVHQTTLLRFNFHFYLTLFLAPQNVIDRLASQSYKCILDIILKKGL